MTFETKQQAVDFLKKTNWLESTSKGTYYPTGVYELKHGEYDRYELKPVFRKGKGWSIKKIVYYYPGTFNCEQDHFLSDDEFFYMFDYDCNSIMN